MIQNINKKFKVKLSRSEMEVLFGMMVFSMYHFVERQTLAELAQASRLYRLAKRVQRQSESGHKQRYTLTLNIEEADACEELFRLLELLGKIDEATPLARVVMYKVRDAVWPNM